MYRKKDSIPIRLEDIRELCAEFPIKERYATHTFLPNIIQITRQHSHTRKG